jgi:predicted dienelactone hydrolase
MTGFVGSRRLLVRDEAKDLSFPVFVMYPTSVPSGPVAFGPYSIEVSPDAPVEGGPFPLVVFSHGGGSTYLVYRTLAWHLAKSGYVVAMPEHPGNNRNDNTLNDTIENLELRPRHVRLAIDAVASDAQFQGQMDSTRVAVVGHSLGGYTALAVAGGQPWAGMGQKIEVTPDARVKALVLMAPATGWFGPTDSLKGVAVPILLFSAEHDRVTPRWQAQLVLDLVPDRAAVTFRLVENANHYSFLSPFPPSMKKPNFPPSVDPEGFDREAFHARLNEDVRAFLDRALKRHEG